MSTAGTAGKRVFGARGLGLATGLGLLLWTLVTSPPAGLSEAGWRTAGTGLLMAVWWVTEAIPIPATSLVPLVAFPLLGVAALPEAAAPYAHPLIFLFMGGFMIALAMERWGLPRRISLHVVGAVGTRPTRLVGGFMVSTAFFSMWVSNTATTLMMLPIGLSVIELVKEEPRASRAGAPADPDSGRHAAADPGSGTHAPANSGTPGRFSVALMLGIAYAASIGGLGTLIGTPPNAFLAGFMSESYGVDIGFARWMLVGLPVVAVALPLVFLILTRFLHPLRNTRIPGGKGLIAEELDRMGPLKTAEVRVGIVFGLTATLWVVRPVLDDVVPGLSDAGVAVLGALLLFLVPAGSDDPAAPEAWRPASGESAGAPRLLDWETALELPWGVLILFGGGLSLASAIGDSGLTGWIGGGVEGMAGVPAPLLILVVVGVIVLLTELTSNTATAAAFLPVVASVAVGVGQNPYLLAVPAALAASCAFMLPVATPPNAIVYGSGRLGIRQMASAGVWLNLLSVFLVTAAAYLLLPLVLGVELGVVPPWAVP